MVVCRLCAECKQIKLKNIFDESSRLILEKIQRITGALLQHIEGLPTSICIDCFDALNEAFNFRVRCLETQEHFLSVDFEALSETDPSPDTVVEDVHELSDVLSIDGTREFSDVPMDKGECCAVQFNNVTPAPEPSPNSIADAELSEKDTETDDSLSEFEESPLYVCDKCNKSFKTPRTLTTHIKRHVKDKKFQCQICSKEFRESAKLKRHSGIHEGHTGKKRPCCQYCGSTFADVSSKIRHEKSRCKANSKTQRPAEEEKDTKVKEHICERCGKSFRQAFLLRAHLQRHLGDRQILCSMCPKQFYKGGELRRHMRIHTGEKPYACKYCQRGFADCSAVKKHEEKRCSLNFNRNITADEDENESRPYICDQCGLAFREKYRLSLHHQRHLGNRKIQCELCPKKFYKNAELTRHMRFHTGEKPFVCQYCPRSFAETSTRTKHEQRHRNERQFVCNFCGKASNTASDLKTHMSYHTGERALNCDTCNSAFRNRTQLKQHYRSLKHQKNLKLANKPSEES